ADARGVVASRSAAAGACAAARGDPGPGRVHLTVPWREPLAPVPAEGQVTAGDPLAIHGRGDSPLNAVVAAPPRASEATLDRIAARMESAERGLIVAGRWHDPAVADPVGSLAAAAG